MPSYITRLRLVLKILMVSARTGAEVVSFVIPIVRAIAGMIRELKKK